MTEYRTKRKLRRCDLPHSFTIFSSFFVLWSTPLDSRPCSLSNVHFTFCIWGNVLFYSVLKPVHVCVAAQTNDALGCQKGRSGHLYKSARSTISSDNSPSAARIIFLLTQDEAKKKPRKKKFQFCSPPLKMPKLRGFLAAIRRVKSKPKVNFLNSKFQCALLQMLRCEYSSFKDPFLHQMDGHNESQHCPLRGCAH